MDLTSDPVESNSSEVGNSAPVITKAQKEILRMSWSLIQSKMETMGVIIFLRLFETHPQTLTPFLPHINSVKEQEMDEWYQEKLRVHALRVMAVVEKTMHRLDSEEKAAQVRLTSTKNFAFIFFKLFSM